MHFLTKLSLYNRWITFLLGVALIGVSLWATLRMKQEMIPNIELGMTTIMTVYPGASPQMVMDEATTPVEEAILGMDGLKRTSSTSVQNMSFVIAEFEYGTNMDKVNNSIGEKLEEIDLPNAIRGYVPEGQTSNPFIYPLDISMIPIVAYSISAVGMTPNELYSIVSSQVVPALSEDSQDEYLVSVEGGQEKVVVTPDAGKMNDNNIPMAQLLLALSDNQYSSEDQVLDVPVADSTVRVRDVATVSIGPAPGTAISRTNAETSVIFYVTKLPEANTVEVAKEVNAKVQEIRGAIEEDGTNVSFIKVFDQSDYIKDSIGELTQDALIGGILAVIVIFIFLLTVRGSMVIALSIPFSIFVGFLIMSAVGVTINILTLGAMTIAVGRIVDDSIVMLEVIYRRLRQGQPFKQAALEGSKEVAMPIASATVATVAIFIPLAFVGGIVGEMFIPFAETITFALLGSLLISLTVVPALSGILVPKNIRPESENAWYQRVYMPALKWALAHRAITVFVAVALFAGSLALLPLIGTSFMPSMGQKEISVEVEMPLGTDIKATNQKTLEVESVIKDAMDSGDAAIDIFYTTVGTSSSFSGGFSALAGGGGTNTATIEILLKKSADMNREADDLRDRIAASVGGAGKITVTPLAASMGSFDPSAFRIYLTSDNYSEVIDAANHLTTSLGDVNGLENIEADIAQTVPQPRYSIDITKASNYALASPNPPAFAGSLEQEMTAMLMGTPVPSASVNGMGLYVNGIMQTATTTEELGGLRISAGLATPFRLSDITNGVTIVSEPTNIRRIDGVRSSTVTAIVTKKDVGAVTSEAQKEINTIESEFNVTASQGGVAEQMNKTFRDMGIAMIIAIVISFAIVVVSFRSFLSAILIMVSLPLASIGALLGLLVTGNTLGASGMMGMVMLVGIVLTNAIVLLALVDQLRKQGMNTYDALVIGGRTRIRPILMTAITTMVGLVPLALGYGQGILLASELAIVVLGGLVSSTLLTLIVVPVLYSLTDRFRRRATVKVTEADATTEKPTGA
jgi:HAE1 family hydrophobic/amphiphilic exporter-1